MRMDLLVSRSPHTKAPERRCGMHRLILAAPWLLICNFGVAQQSQPEPVPDAPVPSQQTQTTSTPFNPIQGGVGLFKLLDRKSLVFPDLATSKGPLSGLQKFELAANNSVGLATIGGALIGSAYNQAVDSPSGYGQGGDAYAKRFGSDMARAASINMFGNFLLATTLHQDPRFFVKKDLSFKQSVEYAAVRVVITGTDAGKDQVNYSGLIGPLMAEGLANVYYPDENRSAGETLTRYASDLGWKFGGNLLRQYWPTINKRLRLLPEPSPASGPNGSDR
jgi:hypothetical protein